MFLAECLLLHFAILFVWEMIAFLIDELAYVILKAILHGGVQVV